MIIYNLCPSWNSSKGEHSILGMMHPIQYRELPCYMDAQPLLIILKTPLDLDR